MKSNILAALTVCMLVACGNKDTYVQNDPLVPNKPSVGNTIIAQGDNGASTSLTYTEVGDGSVLVSCGDNCSVTVFDANKTGTVR